MNSNNIYEFECEEISGKTIKMDQFKGKTVLIVNTASNCGFTKQYEGLQELYVKYKDQGFEVLGFPCNQFGGQEPDSEDKIEEACKLNFGVNFTLFKKMKVNGSGAHPLFKFLKKKLPGLLTSSIKWNFTKFLINSEGVPFKRYAPTTTPIQLTADIEQLLGKNTE